MFGLTTSMFISNIISMAKWQINVNIIGFNHFLYNNFIKIITESSLELL